MGLQNTPASPTCNNGTCDVDFGGDWYSHCSICKIAHFRSCVLPWHRHDEMNWWSSDIFICKDGFTNYNKEMIVAFFVTILQGWAYKTQQTREMHASNQTCLLWQYCNDGLTKTQQTFHAFMIVWCFLCNNVARMGVQNTTNTRDACEQSDVFFVKILQGWAYKTQQTVSNTRDALMIVWCMRLY